MESLTAPLQTLLSGVTAFLAAHPLVGSWYTAFVRFLFPVVAFLILFRAFRSFGPYCRGLGGDSPPSRRRHCLSLYYFDSVKSASITSSSAFLPPAAPGPGWAPAAPAASAPGCWP